MALRLLYVIAIRVFGGRATCRYRGGSRKMSSRYTPVPRSRTQVWVMTS
jgi:hypothetical protein